MEDEVERRLLADLRADLALDVREDRRTQLDGTRLVDAVHVAEREGRQVAALLAGAEGLDGLQAVLGRGVELLVDLGLVAVLLATDDADLDLEDRAGRLRELEQLRRDDEVLVERDVGAVEHVRLERRVLAARDLLRLEGEERADPRVEVLLDAVVGVQRDRHAVVLRDLGGVRGERERAGDAVLDRRAGGVLGATDGDLDDAVRLGLREALDGGGDGLGRRDVDGGVGELAGLRPVDHLGVDLGGCDGHRGISWCSGSGTTRVCHQPAPAVRDVHRDTCPTHCRRVVHAPSATPAAWSPQRPRRAGQCVGTCWRAHACIAIAAAAPALRERVLPCWVMWTTTSHTACAASVRPVDS